MYGPYQRIVLPDGSTLLVGALNQQGFDGYLNQSYNVAATLWGTPPILTIDGVLGTIDVDPPVNLITKVQVAGFGGLADNLTGINAPVAFIGKFLLLQIAGLGNITVVNGAGILIDVNFVMDNVADRLLLECVGVNSWVQIQRSSNA